MNIKNPITIVASTNREALRLVRERLGPDAIVLSNRAIEGGVEIVATAELAAVPPAPQAPQVVPAGPQPIAPPHPQPQLAAALQVSADAGAVLGEIQSMRGMLEAQLGELVWNEKQKRDPVRGQLLRALLGSGFSARLAKAMLEHLPAGTDYAQGLEWAKSELARKLMVLDNEEAMLDAGGVYALVGPTGVGKTTTTAKLAARCVMRFGPEKLALLTTDSYRIGAYEQLRIYGQILGVPAYAVKDATELRMVLDDLRDKHMVLIDTVGMSQRDRNVAEQVSMLCGAGRPVRRLLLLNAASHGDTLNEVVYSYRQAGLGMPGNELAGCIFTKMDEATHPGALIDTAIRHRLAVHYLSSGQKVPENLARAERGRLIESVFQAGSQSALFVPGEADLERLAPPEPEPGNGEAAAEAATAHATADRLRDQCRKLIRTLAHDAQELSANAAALAAGPVGFEGARSLWRSLADDALTPKAVAQELLTQARADIETGCAQHALALTGAVGLGPPHAPHISLLLSDRDGMPLAALNPLMGGAAPELALRQVDWLRQQQFGKPLVYLPPRMPTPEQIADWHAAGTLWMARGRGDLRVTDMESNEDLALSWLAGRLVYGDARPVLYKGEAALQSVAQATIRLRPRAAGVGAGPVLRCVITRTTARDGGKLLEQRYLLAHIGIQASPRQIARWHDWRSAAAPYFDALSQGARQCGGCDQPGQFGAMMRFAVLARVGATVWRLKHAPDDWARAARRLLAQLSGRQRPVRPGQPVPAAVLYEGLARLFVLLDALDADGAAAPAPERVAAQV